MPCWNPTRSFDRHHLAVSLVAPDAIVVFLQERLLYPQINAEQQDPRLQARNSTLLIVNLPRIYADVSSLPSLVLLQLQVITMFQVLLRDKWADSIVWPMVQNDRGGRDVARMPGLTANVTS